MHKGKKYEFKTQEPLTAEAFIKEIKLVYASLDAPQSENENKNPLP